MHVVYHGLGADFTDRVTAGAGTPTPDREPLLRILGVGRLVPKKGFDTFVEACAVLRASGVAFQADIAGEPGEHGAAVSALVERLGLAVPGTAARAAEPAQLYELYRRADVFSLACRVTDNGDRDGIPNVLVEAMACGAPVVSTTVSGIPELVRHGVNGLLVPPDDPVALAAAWLRVHDDPALARRLGAAARAHRGQRLRRRGVGGSAGRAVHRRPEAALPSAEPVRRHQVEAVR